MLARGDRAAKLAGMLRSGHKGRIKLPPDALRRIIAWLDLNCQYRGHCRLRRETARR